MTVQDRSPGGVRGPIWFDQRGNGYTGGVRPKCGTCGCDIAQEGVRVVEAAVTTPRGSARIERWYCPEGCAP